MPRLALVHDYLLVMRGAERVFASMSDVWPDAPLYTLLYDEDGDRAALQGPDRDHLAAAAIDGSGSRSFRLLFPVLGFAMRAFSFEGYDGVVSSSSAFAHLVNPPPGVPHVCYCHAPFRYAWMSASVGLPEFLRPALQLMMRRHRVRDRRVALEVDRFVANSRFTQERIKRFWGRDSTIIHPPVEVERFSVGEPEDYILFVGELVKHKGADRAIEAARIGGRRLKIVGGGPELPGCAPNPPGTWSSWDVSATWSWLSLYQRAAALLVPNVEEFSIVAVEAQAAGRPVVAVDAGGVRETVRPGETGILVPSADPAELGNALATDLNRFDSELIHEHATVLA